jgi:hypothetical protein
MTTTAELVAAALQASQVACVAPATLNLAERFREPELAVSSTRA